MKKTQSEEREELNVVYSYLKMLTLTGGLAIISLTLIGHTLITTFKENLSRQMVAKHPVPPAELPPASVQPVPTFQHELSENTINQPIANSGNEPTTVEEFMPSAELLPTADSQVPLEVVPNPNPEELAIVEVETVPSAQIDVFPAGYGTFRILIESNTTDRFAATLTDMLHQEIVTEQYEVAQGKNEFLLESGEIPRGDYVLKVSNGELTSQKRVTLK